MGGLLFLIFWALVLVSGGCSVWFWPCLCSRLIYRSVRLNPISTTSYCQTSHVHDLQHLPHCVCFLPYWTTSHTSHPSVRSLFQIHLACSLIPAVMYAFYSSFCHLTWEIAREAICWISCVLSSLLYQTHFIGMIRCWQGGFWHQHLPPFLLCQSCFFMSF